MCSWLWPFPRQAGPPRPAVRLLKWQILNPDSATSPCSAPLATSDLWPRGSRVGAAHRSSEAHCKWSWGGQHKQAFIKERTMSLEETGTNIKPVSTSGLRVSCLHSSPRYISHKTQKKATENERTGGTQRLACFWAPTGTLTTLRMAVDLFPKTTASVPAMTQPLTCYPSGFPFSARSSHVTEGCHPHLWLTLTVSLSYGDSLQCWLKMPTRSKAGRTCKYWMNTRVLGRLPSCVAWATPSLSFSVYKMGIIIRPTLLPDVSNGWGNHVRKPITVFCPTVNMNYFFPHYNHC